MILFEKALVNALKFDSDKWIIVWISYYCSQHFNSLLTGKYSKVVIQLDESAAHWHLKWPQSLSVGSLHLAFQGHGQGQTRPSLRPSVHSICILFILWQSNHLWLRYSIFKIWPWKFKVKVMAKVKSSGHVWGLELNWYVCFLFCGNRTIFGRDIMNSIFELDIFVQGHSQGQIRWSHLRLRVKLICLLFVLWQSDHFWLRYSEFHIWPWKFEVKVMKEVKSDGHIWGLEFNRKVCFLSRATRTVFGPDIANSIFDFENRRSRSRHE